MLNRRRIVFTQKRIAAALLCPVLLALWLPAGCTVDAGADTALPARTQPPTAQTFRFPTPTFTPPPTATTQAATSTPATTPATTAPATTAPAIPIQAPLAPATPAPVASPTPYRLAALNNDLAAAYPAKREGVRFTLHYDPETPPAIAPDQLTALVMQILAHHEQVLGVTLGGHFDVYAAGTLFAAPDQALRGHSFSRLRYFQVVVDNDIASPAQRYIVAHELTHLFAWNTFGVPSSVLLSEGLAVYAGLDFVGGELLSLHDFCAAYAQAGALPYVSDDLAYQGHIRNLEHYYAAGCFVQFLIEQHGVAAFAQLYPSGDYVSVYGQTLRELEAEWLTATAARPISTALDPAALVTAVTETKRVYLDLLMDFDGRRDQVDAYRRLDAQWAAVLAGQLPADNTKETGAEHE